MHWIENIPRTVMPLIRIALQNTIDEIGQKVPKDRLTIVRVEIVGVKYLHKQLTWRRFLVVLHVWTMHSVYHRSGHRHKTKVAKS